MCDVASGRTRPPSSFPRSAWERSVLDALRPGTVDPASVGLLPATQSVARPRSHAERGNEEGRQEVARG
jgi:hypothetical protein